MSSPRAFRGGARKVTDFGGSLIVDDRIFLNTWIGASGRRGPRQEHATLGSRAERGPGEAWKPVEAFERTLPGVRAWLGGTALNHGDRVTFGKGYLVFPEGTRDA